MYPYLRSILSPILSLFILVVGNGYLLTLVPVRAGLEGFSPTIIGYLASLYFAGILIGALRINRLIEGVGHIRAFAFFASMLSILTLVQGLFVEPWVWLISRFLFGLAIAGVFITIESWLLVKCPIKKRGTALSIYMTVFYAGISTGQLFLGVFDGTSLIPFCFIVILTSLSVLPLTITKTKAPIVEEQSVLSLKKLFKIAPLSIFGAIFAGLVLGPIYGLLPVYAQDLKFTETEISWIMSSLILGGLIFQWPIGMISDRIDRRKIIFIASVIASVLALIAGFSPKMELSRFLIFSSFFGGVCFVLYPLSISHACDSVENNDIVAATGAVLVSYGLGSILGPILSSYAMSFFGASAFFYFLVVAAGSLALLALYYLIVSKKVPIEEKMPYHPVPNTTPIALELDPRSEEGHVTEKDESSPQ